MVVNYCSKKFYNIGPEIADLRDCTISSPCLRFRLYVYLPLSISVYLSNVIRETSLSVPLSHYISVCCYVCLSFILPSVFMYITLYSCLSILQCIVITKVSLYIFLSVYPSVICLCIHHSVYKPFAPVCLSVCMSD